MIVCWVVLLVSCSLPSAVPKRQYTLSGLTLPLGHSYFYVVHFWLSLDELSTADFFFCSKFQPPKCPETYPCHVLTSVPVIGWRCPLGSLVGTITCATDRTLWWWNCKNWDTEKLRGDIGLRRKENCWRTCKLLIQSTNQTKKACSCKQNCPQGIKKPKKIELVQHIVTKTCIWHMKHIRVYLEYHALHPVVRACCNGSGIRYWWWYMLASATSLLRK